MIDVGAKMRFCILLLLTGIYELFFKFLVNRFLLTYIQIIKYNPKIAFIKLLRRIYETKWIFYWIYKDKTE